MMFGYHRSLMRYCCWLLMVGYRRFLLLLIVSVTILQVHMRLDFLSKKSYRIFTNSTNQKIICWGRKNYCLSPRISSKLSASNLYSHFLFSVFISAVHPSCSYSNHSLPRWCLICKELFDSLVHLNLFILNFIKLSYLIYKRPFFTTYEGISEFICNWNLI